MKAIFLSLLVIAVVFALSSALPDNSTRGRQKSLIYTENKNEKFLQKKKPPGKVPGPSLTQEFDPVSLAGVFYDSQPKMKHLAEKDENKRKKGPHLRTNRKYEDFARLDRDSKSNDKRRGQHLLSGERYTLDLKEETQEERNTDV